MSKKPYIFSIKHYIKVYISGFLCLVVIGAIFNFFIKQSVQREKEIASHIIQQNANDIRNNFVSIKSLSSCWRDLLIESDGKIKHFDSIAREQEQRFPFINSIVLCKDGIVSHVYPDTAQTFENTNLFQWDITGPICEKLKKSAQDVIIGPIAFFDGNSGFVHIESVFLDDGSFWGFICISFCSKNLVSNRLLTNLINNGYEYLVTRKNDSTQEKEIVLQSSTKALSDAVEHTFGVFNETWSIAIEPSEKWISKTGSKYFLIVVLVLGFLVIITIALINHLDIQGQSLESLVIRDAVTNIFNDRKYKLDLNYLKSTGVSYSQLYINVNDFKNINDAFGRDTGDEVLRICAKKLSNCIRHNDKLYRNGGSDFTILVKDIKNAEFFAQLKSRIKEAFEQSINVNGNSIKLSITLTHSIHPHNH